MNTFPAIARAFPVITRAFPTCILRFSLEHVYEVPNKVQSLTMLRYSLEYFIIEYWFASFQIESEGS